MRQSQTSRSVPAGPSLLVILHLFFQLCSFFRCVRVFKPVLFCLSQIIGYQLALKLNGHTEILRYLHLILDATALTYTGKRRSPQPPQPFHLPFSSQVALHPKQLHVEAVPSRLWCVQRGSRRVNPSASSLATSPPNLINFQNILPEARSLPRCPRAHPHQPRG